MLRTIISCETRGCHAEIQYLNSIVTRKDVTELIRQHKWITIKHKGNRPNHSHHCAICVIKGRV